MAVKDDLSHCLFELAGFLVLLPKLHFHPGKLLVKRGPLKGGIGLFVKFTGRTSRSLDQSAIRP